MKQTKTITETMRVVDDEGNIIKTGDPDTDAVSDRLTTITMVAPVNFLVGRTVVTFVLNRRMFEPTVD